ncbi:MAG TPA: methylated-DNA--[protein]-cysteine S-methyltransferase [Rhodocyclaceae bacterium]
MNKLFPDYDAVLRADFFCLGLRSDARNLTEITFLPLQEARKPCSELATAAVQQFQQWLRHPDFVFTLPLVTAATPFRQRVWQAISSINFGETRTYGDLATSLNSSPRAVGSACGDNPFPIIVPCHRVVARTTSFNQGLGGFAHSTDGLHMDIKRWLLERERRHV